MQKGHRCKKIMYGNGVVVSPWCVFAPGGFVFGIKLWAYVCWLLSVQITQNICGSRNFWRGRGRELQLLFPSFIPQGEGGIALKMTKMTFMGVQFSDQSRGLQPRNSPTKSANGLQKRCVCYSNWKSQVSRTNAI